jgi:hypothetical protein
MVRTVVGSYAPAMRGIRDLSQEYILQVTGIEQSLLSLSQDFLMSLCPISAIT